jgi:hypothetical protein
VVIGDTAANIAAKLGGGAAISRCLTLTAAPDSATPDIAANGGQADSTLFAIDNAAAAAVANVHAAVQESAANQFVGVFTSPAIPRNLSVTFAAGWQGGDVNVFGINQFGGDISETFLSTPGATVAGVKIFKTVTAAAKTIVAGTVDTASIGQGNKLGVSPKMSAGTGILFTDSAIEAVTIDSANSGFLPTTVPNGVHDYLLLYNA